MEPNAVILKYIERRMMDMKHLDHRIFPRVREPESDEETLIGGIEDSQVPMSDIEPEETELFGSAGSSAAPSSFFVLSFESAMPLSTLLRCLAMRTVLAMLRIRRGQGIAK